MISRELNHDIDKVLGKELQGKLNENLILILLYQNYEHINAAAQSGFKGFRGHKDRNIREGMTTRMLADELDLAQSTVATAVKRLKEYGYVTHSKGMPVKTTELGRTIAEESLKHHRLLEVMMVDQLGITHDLAHEESLKLMLLASCELIEKIDEVYGHPTSCPGGMKIPEVDLGEIFPDERHLPTKAPHA